MVSDWDGPCAWCFLLMAKKVRWVDKGLRVQSERGVVYSLFGEAGLRWAESSSVEAVSAGLACV